MAYLSLTVLMRRDEKPLSTFGIPIYGARCVCPSVLACLADTGCLLQMTSFRPVLRVVIESMEVALMNCQDVMNSFSIINAHTYTH